MASTGKILLHSLEIVCVTNVSLIWNFILREYDMPCALEKISLAEVSEHKQKRMRHPVFAVILPYLQEC